jgi:hypothetical protein
VLGADKVNQMVPVVGIECFQILGRVLVFAVAQVGGQHRQGALGGLALGFDAF